MQNLKDKNADQKDSPTALGMEEMNSMIKSFQESSFNTEELYKRDEKVFVKKTLYDLAIEADKTKKSQDIKTQETSTKIQNSEVKDHKDDPTLKNKDDLSQEENSNNFDQSSAEKSSTEQSSEELSSTEQSSEELSSAEQSSAEQSSTEQSSTEQSSTEQSSTEQSSTEQSNLAGKDNSFEENTLEALDSVRNAVEKSLDQNIDEGSDVSETKDALEKDISSGELKSTQTLKDEFNSIQNLLGKINQETLNLINETIKEKVIQISYEISGHYIDKFPQKFLDRIKSTVDGIFNQDEKPTVFLNEEDIKSVEKIKKEENYKFFFKFDLDESLKRGDFRIKCGGIDHLITNELEVK